MSATVSEHGPTRRGLLDWIIRICGAITGLALLGPALAYLWPVTRTGPVKVREEVGPVAGWGVWEARKVSVAEKPVLVLHTDKGFLAFSAVCTHLGCLVEFDNAKRNILCPCHGGVFDLDGRPIAGPPPRPLAVLNVSVDEGKVCVAV